MGIENAFGAPQPKTPEEESEEIAEGEEMRSGSLTREHGASEDVGSITEPEMAVEKRGGQ